MYPNIQCDRCKVLADDLNEGIVQPDDETKTCKRCSGADAARHKARQHWTAAGCECRDAATCCLALLARSVCTTAAGALPVVFSSGWTK